MIGVEEKANEKKCADQWKAEYTLVVYGFQAETDSTGLSADANLLYVKVGDLDMMIDEMKLMKPLQLVEWLDMTCSSRSQQVGVSEA